MKGMLENHPLFLSVFVCVGGVVVASWEMAPQLNDLIQLAPFPNDTYRYKVVILVVSTIFGTFLWDRLCTMMFAPRVFQAMIGEASRTTIQDIKPVRTCVCSYELSYVHFFFLIFWHFYFIFVSYLFVFCVIFLTCSDFMLLFSLCLLSIYLLFLFPYFSFISICIITLSFVACSWTFFSSLSPSTLSSLCSRLRSR